MAQGHDKPIISVVHSICCGLDVHKASISACWLATATVGGEDMEIGEFDTFTDDLIRLRDWLIERDCYLVTMESTGVYWRPVHNVLEGFVKVVLVNARHTKHVPGRGGARPAAFPGQSPGTGQLKTRSRIPGVCSANLFWA
jgi:transposase